MTAEELNETLKALGWRGKTLAHRLNVSENIVSLWRTGQIPVPGYVEEYLRVMLLAKRMMDSNQ